jgi:hypothetical protein
MRSDGQNGRNEKEKEAMAKSIFQSDVVFDILLRSSCDGGSFIHA